ncbi:MAG: LysM peptidoglycan-binding domain-containing protein [Microcoleus sp.]
MIQKPLSAIASNQLTSIKRKSRKYSFGAIISHLTIASLILGMVAIGYQAPTGNVSALNSAQPSANSSDNISATLDQVASANMAAVAAQSSDSIVTTNVVNYAGSLKIKSATAQSNESVLNKPQIMDQSANQRGVHLYTTKAGDTVSSIAATSGVSADTIRWANNLISDAVSPGTSLKIAGVSGIVYTVKAGDTADSLATKYKSTSSRITTYNDAELTGLQSGQQIVIPGGTLPSNERPGYSTPAPRGGIAYSTAMTLYGGNTYDYGYCTYYVFNKRAAIGRPVGSNWGNAVSWASYARSAGITVDHAPSAGAVLQNGGGYGHVAFVEQVNADGSVRVSEMNFVGWNKISSRTLSAGEAAGYNFIH